MLRPMFFKAFNSHIYHFSPFYASNNHLLLSHTLINQRTLVRNTMTNLSTIEKCKAAAAKLAVDENIISDCIVGIGSGSTMRYVVERIVHVIKQKGISVKCIPTSFQSKQLIYDYGLPITELDCYPTIDVAIDGADEVDENLVAIKGGGACLAQEKIVAFASKRFVVVADYRKNSKYLGENWTKGIPIEVLPMACNAVRHYICKEFDTELTDIQIRTGNEKAGPVITDNGNQVLDWKFNFHSLITSASNLQPLDWKAISDQVKLIPGVVETGIFANMIHQVNFGEPDGTVSTKLLQKI